MPVGLKNAARPSDNLLVRAPPVSHRAVALDVFQAMLVDTRL
jgi:hypothetical protein